MLSHLYIWNTDPFFFAVFAIKPERRLKSNPDAKAHFETEPQNKKSGKMQI